jgi:hypothetical protein
MSCPAGQAARLEWQFGSPSTWCRALATSAWGVALR